MGTKKKCSVASNCKTKFKKTNSKSKKKHLPEQREHLKSRFQLKDVRIVLHNIATDDLIPLHQRYLITKKINVRKVINNCKESASKEINKSKQIDLKKRSNNSNELISSTDNSYDTIIKECSSEKKKAKRIKIKKQFVDTKPSCAKVQNTCLVKFLPFNHNDNIKENDFNINEKKKSKIFIPDRDNKNELKKDLNCKENTEINFVNNDNFMNSKRSDEITHNKFSTKSQSFPLISEDINKVNLPKSNEVKIMPRIIENFTLSKNNVILRKTNNLHRKDCSREINKPSLVELYNKAAKLSIENLHKFNENYQEKHHQQLQINRSPNTTDTNFLNDKNKDMKQQMNINDSTGSSTKRKRHDLNKVTQFNQTCNKKFKLNRSFVERKSLSATNNFLFINGNSNSSSKYDNVNINGNAIQDIDNRVTLFCNNDNNYNNNNTLCKVTLRQESNKIDYDMNKNISNNPKTIFNLENEKNELKKDDNSNLETILYFENEKDESKLIKEYDTNVENCGEDNLCKHEISACSTQLDQQKLVKNKTQDDSDDDDYISIYSNASFILDGISMTSYENIETNKENKIAPNTSDTSKQHNNLKHDKALNTIVKSDIPINKKLTNLQNTIEHEKEKQRNNVSSMKTISTQINKSIISMINGKSNLVNNNNNNNNNNSNKTSSPNDYCNVRNTNTFSDNENVVQESMKIQSWSSDMHRQYCSQIMKSGVCINNINKKCHLEHELQKLITHTVLNYKEHLTNILFHLCTLKYTYLLGKLYIKIVDELNIISILSIYKQFYLQERPYFQFVYVTVQALLEKKLDPKYIINELCKIHCDDKLTLHYILISIKQKIKSHEYWNILKTLFEFIKPDKEIIEGILNNCIINRKYVQDININLIQKLHPDEINQLDKNLMSSFNNLLLQHQYEDINDKLFSYYVDGFQKNYDERSSNKSCISRSVSDLLKQQCLYSTPHNLKNKLLLGDYDYVINTLTIYTKIDRNETLFYRYCFQIFCKEINFGEYYVSEIIKHAVKTGVNYEIIDVLIDIAIYILMKLVINKIWVLAYKLLKTLQIYIKNYNATFLLLSAEIYLAHNQIYKAFLLFKENIISSNRGGYNVVSKPEDRYLKTKIIKILLDAIYKESSENAFFMFQFLATYQKNNYEPIDLLQYVDKLMLKLLSEMNIELVAAMGHLIIKCRFTFTNTTICRAAIVSLFHSDIMLAKKLYQYVSKLGIYESIKELSTETQPYVKQFYDPMTKINFSQKLVKRVLDTWFDPSLISTMKLNGNKMELNSTSVINYLSKTCDYKI
ncbi:hypothetical protein M0802_003847 [Mischocyttarus mexicanus]|nr:hypothetical protein M0802_003847 [Mischocyttarus mexicanus]